jgi:hypothetical protein
VWLGRIEPGHQHIQHPTNSSQISQDFKKLLGWAGIAVGRSQGLV